MLEAFWEQVLRNWTVEEVVQWVVTWKCADVEVMNDVIEWITDEKVNGNELHTILAAPEDWKANLTLAARTLLLQELDQLPALLVV